MILASPVQAQGEAVNFPDEADWTHKATGLTVTPEHEGFVRDGVRQYAEDEMNVSVQLHDADRSTSITVYVYRAGVANVSIWADRALTAMLGNPAMGSPVGGQLFMGRFTPINSSGEDSGFHAVTSLEGANVRATGMSMFAHDDWLIKVRASSSRLDEAGITEAIGSVISGFKLGESEEKYPTVEFIEPCEKGLKFAKKIKLTQLDLIGQLMFVPLTEHITVASKGKDTAKNSWCRDPQSTLEVGIYRSGNDNDSFVAALGDSGINAYVAKFRTSSELLKARGFIVKTSDGIEEATWPIFDKLPHPVVIARNYGEVGPLATVDVRPGGDGDTTIMVNPSSIPD
jgi:hypothetical protein